MKRVLLIDADIPIYKACAASASSGAAAFFDTTDVANISEQKQLIDVTFAHWMERLAADDMVCCLSDHTRNFRKEWWQLYKANRTRPKPVGYYELEQYVIDTYKTKRMPSFEADDVCGIEATRKVGTEQRVIVSIDKDFCTVPGFRYDPGDPDSWIQETTLEEADFFHLVQTLAGDHTDGYKGIPGIGMVKAQKYLLDHADDLHWEVVVALYEAHDMTEEDALRNARMARILRKGDYKRHRGKGDYEALQWKPMRRWTLFHSKHPRWPWRKDG